MKKTAQKVQKDRAKPKRLRPLFSVRGNGLSEEFKNAGWEKIRDAIYEGHGA